jgi:hypothetical protein
MTATDLLGLTEAVERLAAIIPVLLIIAIAAAFVGLMLAGLGGRR